MEKYYVNKDYIIGVIRYKGISIRQFCREIGVKPNNFWVALNRPYAEKRSRTITKAMIKLGLVEGLVWKEEE